jgi:hypothetical protein
LPSVTCYTEAPTIHHPTHLITKFNYCLEAWKSQPLKLINQLIRRYIFCSIIWATRTENFKLHQTVLFRFQKKKKTNDVLCCLLRLHMISSLRV